MSFYLDTSVVIAFLTNEEATQRVTNWLRHQGNRPLAISLWVKTEVSAALSIKIRTGHLDPGMRSAALAQFARLSANTFDLIDVGPSQFEHATKLADQYMIGLRSGDALHLAIAAASGLTLCTLDKRLAKAGIDLGISTRQL